MKTSFKTVLIGVFIGSVIAFGQALVPSTGSSSSANTSNAATITPGFIDAGVVLVNTELHAAGLASFNGTQTSCGTNGVACIGARSASTDVCLWMNPGSTVDHTTCNLRGDTSQNTFVNGAAIAFQIGSFTKGGLGVTGKWFFGAAGDNLGSLNTGTATLDFASANVNTCSSDLTINVTGALTTSTVSLGVPNGSVAAGSQFFSWVSSTGVVTVRHCCVAGTSCDPASGTFRVWTINI